MKFNRIIAAALCAATLASTTELVAWESSEVAQTIFEPSTVLDISPKGKDQGFFVFEILAKEFDALCKEFNVVPEVIVEEAEVAAKDVVTEAQNAHINAQATEEEVTVEDYTSVTQNHAWTLVKVTGALIAVPVVLAAAYLASHIDLAAQWLSLTNTTHPDSLKMCGLDEENGIFLTSSRPLKIEVKENTEPATVTAPSTPAEDAEEVCQAPHADFYLVCKPEDEPTVAPEQPDVKENTEPVTEPVIVNEPSTPAEVETPVVTEQPQAYSVPSMSGLLYKTFFKN
ncbi:hypothetical protein K2W90_03530 [Candidatus Babeliales bacterium]|nr:hypothetical protein [Candidatus Babeliales bacterium]